MHTSCNLTWALRPGAGLEPAPSTSEFSLISKPPSQKWMTGMMIATKYCCAAKSAPEMTLW